MVDLFLAEFLLLYNTPHLWELHLLLELGNSIFVQHLRKRRVGHGPLWTSSVALTSRVQRGRNTQ